MVDNEYIPDEYIGALKFLKRFDLKNEKSSLVTRIFSSP